MSKSEYIIWECETEEQIRGQHPNWNNEQVRKYLSAVKAILENLDSRKHMTIKSLYTA